MVSTTGQSVRSLLFRQVTHQFIKCVNASFLNAPVSDDVQLYPLHLLAANEQGLIEVGPRLPVDIAGKAILDAVGWRQKPKYPSLHRDFVGNHRILLADFNRPTWELQKQMKTVRMLVIP